MRSRQMTVKKIYRFYTYYRPLLTIEVIDEWLQPQSQNIEYRRGRILPLTPHMTGKKGRHTSLDAFPPRTISGPLSIHPRAFAQISFRTAWRSSSFFHPPPGVVGLIAGRPFVMSKEALFDSTVLAEWVRGCWAIERPERLLHV
jgi:hypothetical protein